VIDNQLDAEMYLMARRILLDMGYYHYEISNFALPGYESKHNLLYWQYQPYLGLGPAAHSFDEDHRYANPADLGLYLKRLSRGDLPLEEEISLNRKDRMAEMLFMGLRLTEGVSRQKFKNRFGVEIQDVYPEELKRLKEFKLIVLDKKPLKLTEKGQLTEKGLLLGNEVFMSFINLTKIY